MMITPENLAWYEWLSTVGTNAWIGGFLLNNAILLGATSSVGFLILKFIAKKTPGTEDDEFFSELENMIRSKLLSKGIK